MLTKTEKYYQNRLQRYFNRNFGAYEETAEFYVNPVINKWRFIIRELDLEVTLTCNDIGWVVEKRRLLNG